MVGKTTIFDVEHEARDLKKFIDTTWSFLEDKFGSKININKLVSIEKVCENVFQIIYDNGKLKDRILFEISYDHGVLIIAKMSEHTHEMVMTENTNHNTLYHLNNIISHAHTNLVFLCSREMGI